MSVISHLTHSRMGTYEQCPKKYFYEYVLRLKGEPTYPEYGKLGSMGHKIIEDFYEHVTIPCDPENHFDDLIGRLYKNEFKDIEDYKRHMLDGLVIFLQMEIKRYDRLENKDIFKPKYSELYLKSNIAGIRFTGRIDAIYEEPDGMLTAVDYKLTSSNSIGETQRQQGTVYAIMLEQELGIKFESFNFWFLRHGPNKKRVIKTVKITDKLIKEVNQKVFNLAEQINELRFECKQSYLCRFCGYESVCMTEQSGE